MEENKDELEDGEEMEGGCDCNCCHHHCGAPEVEEEAEEGGLE